MVCARDPSEAVQHASYEALAGWPEAGMAERAAIIGGGVIGGGWAARFALMGWDARTVIINGNLNLWSHPAR